MTEPAVRSFPSHRHDALRILLLLALAFLSARCGPADSSHGWSGQIETLPSGMVRVTNPAEGLWAKGTPWRLTRELVLGKEEGEGADVFGLISGMTVDSAGRIYVLDRQADELRIFGPDGSHIRTVGRKGEGPGEYVTANGLVWIGDDTLVVVDEQGNRYTVLTRDGDYIRSIPRGLGFYAWVFNGGAADGRLYENAFVRDGQAQHPALLGTAISETVTPAPKAAEVPEAEAIPAPVSTGDTIMLPELDAPQAQPYSIRTKRGGMVMGVPFTAGPVYSLAADGSIWFGQGSAARIYHATLTGDTLAEIVLDVTPFPVTSEEVANFEAGAGVKQFRAMGGKVDLGRIPKVKPYFDDLFLDPRGDIWLGVPAGKLQTVFDVLDPQGRYLGRLRVDGVSRDAYLHPVVHAGRLYWVGRDELDVQRVYVYRIETQN